MFSNGILNFYFIFSLIILEENSGTYFLFLKKLTFTNFIILFFNWETLFPLKYLLKYLLSFFIFKLYNLDHLYKIKFYLCKEIKHLYYYFIFN